MDKLFYLFVTFIFFSLIVLNIGFSVTSSPLGQFNVTPSAITLNQTNNFTADINVTINSGYQNVTIEILNSTTNVAENYLQGNSLTNCENESVVGYFLFVKDATTGIYINFLSPPLNETNYTTFTILDNIDFDHRQCKPGKYWINGLTLRNTTQTNETASLLVFIDIPISAYNNERLLNNGIGTFGGTLPQYASTYHSYYFNASNIGNATGVSINLTASSDADLFLFDSSGTLRAKSINKTTTTEFLIYSNSTLPNTLWEIRVYGNTSSSSGISYTGYLIYSTLEASSASLDFGTMNASTVNQLNFTLRNIGNITSPNVTETKEIYYVRRFTDSSTKNFTFLVPDSSMASKIKFNLNWTGAGDYSFEVYDQNDNLLSNSTGKHTYANITGAMQEEYNETSPPASANVWRILVKNNTAATNTYTLTVRALVDSSKWLPTSFPSSFTFNNISDSNSVLPVQINFTVQNNTLDGLYEGNLLYLDSRKGGFIIPFKVNVTTPTLIVNNILNNATFTVDENKGINLTRRVDFILNNTGQYDLTINVTNSPGILSCISSSCSGNTTSITFNALNSITATNYTNLGVDIDIPSNVSSGLYEGRVFIDGTNSSLNLTAHPYPSFNITLRLNLTTSLDGRAGAIRNTLGAYSSPWGSVSTFNSTQNETETLRARVFYINKTTEITDLTTDNIMSVWLQEKNVSGSTWRIPSSGSLTFSSGTSPFYTAVGYSINFIVPDSKPGGQYEVHLRFNKTISSTTFTGEATNSSTLIINNTGIYMTTNFTSGTISRGNQIDGYVNVENFGPVASSIVINLTENCEGYDAQKAGMSGSCGSDTTSSTANTYTITPAPFSTSCFIYWALKNLTSNNYGSCASSISGTPTSQFFNPNLITFSITVSNGTSTTTTTSPGEGGLNQGATTTTSTTLPPTTRFLDVTSSYNLINITQGKEGSINFGVKNIDETEFQDINFSIGTINSTWIKQLLPSTAELGPEENVSVSIKFVIPNNTETKDYLAVFKAKSQFGEATKSFTIRVLPSEETKSNITATFGQLKKDFLSLWTDLNNTIASGKNVTEAQTWFNQLKAKMSQAENSINASDYFTAYQLFGDIRDLMNKTKIALGLKGAGFQLSLTMIIIIAVATVVGGGFLAYLFWPTKAAGAKVVKKEGKIEEKKTEEKVIIQPSESHIDSWKKLREKYEKLRKRK